MIGGVIGLRLEPDLLALLSVGRQIVLVTGTNGKTTTTRLITAALGALGQDVASNAFGANMEAGLAAALGKAPDAPLAVLEVDERYLPAVIKATKPRVVTLLNLSRDQMDRAAEIWLVARRWREALAAAKGCWVVANADDPLIAWAASGAEHVIWVAAGQRWHEDSWCCAECGSHLLRDELGWRCGECAFRRPSTRWVLDGDRVIDSAGPPQRPVPVPARPGQPVQRRGRARGERGVRRGDRPGPAPAARRGLDRWPVHPAGPARPAGAAAARQEPGRLAGGLRRARPAAGPVLLAVNAQVPDGKDTSWLWDVDYRVLRGRPVFVSGERRLDLAVRLEADLVAFDLVDGVDEAVDQVEGTSLDVIANYTAFQQIRVALGRAE